MTKLATLTQNYDKAGNLTVGYSADRGTSYVYRYDHHNRLTGVYDSTNTTRKAAFTWDALGRRIEYINDVLSTETHRYWYDGVNEVNEHIIRGLLEKPLFFVHGVSYIDERLAMMTNYLPYYYTLDRMYNVRAVIDRAGAIVERYAYDGYGRPLIRESCGRGDFNNDSAMATSPDSSRFTDVKNGTKWDPRGDLDDDGDVDANDQTLYNAKKPDWKGALSTVTVAQAFSDVDNPYMFQGVPHFALDTQSTDTTDKLSLNHHRARFADCLTGRWNTRDPQSYDNAVVRMPNEASRPSLYAATHDRRIGDTSQFVLFHSNPGTWTDATGLDPLYCYLCAASVIEWSITTTPRAGTSINGGNCPTDATMTGDSYSIFKRCPQPLFCHPITTWGPTQSHTCRIVVTLLNATGQAVESLAPGDAGCSLVVESCVDFSYLGYIGYCWVN